MSNYDEIPEGFLTWSQAERDRFFDERDRAFQLDQFCTAPEVDHDEMPSQEGVALIRISPASSVADPASTFWITRNAAKEFVRRLIAELNTEREGWTPNR